MSDWNTRHRLPAYGSVLDGCCGEGAVSRGLINAGLKDVWGVDSNPALEAGYMRSGAKGFICADILEVLADEKFMSRFAGASISPPCQSGSWMCNCRPGLAATYPQLIGPVRDLLIPLKIPFVIENVRGNRAELINPETLCMWGHHGRYGYRHRLVEGGGGLVLKSPAATMTDIPAGYVRNKRTTPNPECGQLHPIKAAKAGHWKEGLFVSVSGHERKEPVRRVMEINWMSNRDAVAEAVPPYMAQWWGEQLRDHLEAA
jgi:site-specific DNA-cytosine methylase